MNPDEQDRTQISLLDRFRKSWFPPTAVVGAFAAFVAAAFRVRPNPTLAPKAAKPAAAPGPLVQIGKSVPPAPRFGLEYTQAAVLGAAASAHPFRRTLSGVAVGPGDKICALGDEEVRIFDPNGNLVRNWKVVEKAECLTAGPDERIYVGAAGRVEIYDAGGGRVGGFEAGEKNQPAAVTAIKVFRQEILVADAAARFIRRYDLSGKQLGVIGTKSKAGSFMLPNRSLDIAVDSKGVVRATDTGRHQVTAWALDGSPLGSFGKFGMSDPQDFVGCCNPVNLALTPDGKIVTGEKMVARVKVYTPDGKLLAVIGPEHFDPNCIHIHLAVDSRGRILTADPVRREIKIFSPVTKAGVIKPRSLNAHE
ncbi:MAG: NHL repeat-containing protein [Acidobacteriia bacterium]|nr:NHL repeat-containing protein [Terriglobia bacterium]